MSLDHGIRLGPYEVVAPLGSGGMGEVYRARDTKLGREVAIKILPEAFAHDSDRMARFEREAKVLASLNHPNIAGIYGVEDRAIAMELVEGQTLKGPLPLETALNYARQIAEALEAAHEKGIVHRDLKPTNIKITPAGTVKVLDFGLAKAAEEPRATDDPSVSPTLISSYTHVGVLLGTAAYMSPEQARGAAVDKRADIWAFGCVLYEMLTGKQAFHGETTSDILAAVLKEEPDWNAVPAKMQRLSQACLKKDPKQRLHDIADAKLLLEDAPEAASVQSSKWPWALAAAFAVVAVALLLIVMHLREKPPRAAEPVRFQIPPPGKAHFGRHMSLSPDGQRLAFDVPGPDGRSLLWIRSLDALEWRPLPGTESVIGQPFWSPDSRFLAFGADNKLKKIEVSGGLPQVLCDGIPLVLGGAWTRDGVIIFGSATGGLSRVSAAGGIPTPLTALDYTRQENAHMLPFLLPDDRHFIYLRRSRRPENTGIYLGSLDAKPEAQDSKRLLATLVGAVYAPSVDTTATGHLLFLRDSMLMAQPFDTPRLAPTGEPVPVAERVGSIRDIGDFAVSTNGVLAYRSGSGQGTQFSWFDRQGKILGTAGNPSLYYTPDPLALSPDGTRVATQHRDPRTGNLDVWVLDIARNTSTRFTFNPGVNGFPVWSPDGSRIAFASNRDGPSNLYQKISSGAGEEEALLSSDDHPQSDLQGRVVSKIPNDWSHDGRFLLYCDINPKTKFDLWVLPLSGNRKPIPFLRTEFSETEGQFSPNERWIAYRSDESGKPEIYVRPFPAAAGGGGQWMISNGGGTQPRWRRDGKELFYFSGEGTLMSVEVATSAVFKASIPKRLFDTRILAGDTPVLFGSPALYWDVASDGKRFLINTATAESGSEPITVVQNWTAGLKK